MGEVLENGVYLPDEGERNAYNGLKGNWNTVDTVVAQVQALSSTGLIRKPVDELPTEDIETNVIYMLKAEKPNGDIYRIEYMYIDNHWDALGTSETTLDDYYTKTETDDLPAVKSGVNATKVSNYDTHIADTDIHVTLANKATWDGKQNALDTNQTAAVNSGVNATKVTGYDTHVSDTDIHVTTSDKTAWNAKQDGLSQTQLAAVNSGITEAKRTGYDSHVADTNVHVTTTDKAAWNGKQNALTQTQLDNIAAVPDKADSADLATVATTGDYGDLLNAPTIPTVNNATLTIQKNGADVAAFTANASSNVTANLAIPVNTSDLNNDAGFLTQHNPIDTELSATSENALQNKVVKSELDGKAPLVHTHAASDVTSGTFNIARIPNLDASKITSGTIDIARLPKGALERLVKVANQAARYALTTDDVQLGDTVQQLDTGVMYVVTDETKLDSADGYTEFTAGAASSVPWTGVTGKPSDYTPSSHTHGNVTNDGKLPTASRALISDSSKNITVSSVSDTELGYLSGVTSSVQTQLNAKAADSEVVHKTGNEDISGTKTFSAIIKNKLNNAEIAVIPSSTLSTAFRVCDKNDAITANLQYNQYTTGNSDLQLNLRTKDSNNNNISRSVILNTDQYGTWFYFRPSDDSAIALGSAIYKWKSVYADAYYLGTTAFGDIATHNASEFSASTHVHGNITNDGKVGTTANKPLITGTGGAVQAGSFGNAANTFCEGNDSRLSDARTPVAHTHGKADVTDLFNSANTWTDTNTYTTALRFSAANYSAGTPSSDIFYGNLQWGGIVNNSFVQSFGINNAIRTSGINDISLRVWSQTGSTLRGVAVETNADASNSSLRPLVNNVTDLGSSIYQWNNLYAKNYYYNGVAWGLNKANVWSVGQTIRSSYPDLYFQNPGLAMGSNANIGGCAVHCQDTAGNDLAYVSMRVSSAARTVVELCTRNTYKNGVLSNDQDAEVISSSFMFGQLWNGAAYYQLSGGTLNDIYPMNLNGTNQNLGTSTNKWKTLWANGINSVPTDTVEWHNSHYRGINLISTGHFANMAALLTAIRAQDWSDIYIGDYVELTFNYEGASRTVKFYVGEIDKFYKVGNATSVSSHHLVMVTGYFGINQKMNDTATTAGGYVGSKAHTVTLPALYAILNPLFNNAILSQNFWLSNAVTTSKSVSLSLNDGNGATSYTCDNFPLFSGNVPHEQGCVTDGTWVDCNLMLMSEVEMLGCSRFSSSAIEELMCPEGQIAVFKYYRDLYTLLRTAPTWLRNISHNGEFSCVRGPGYVNSNPANGTSCQMRPRFLIG